MYTKEIIRHKLDCLLEIKNQLQGFEYSAVFLMGHSFDKLVEDSRIVATIDSAYDKHRTEENDLALLKLLKSFEMKN